MQPPDPQRGTGSSGYHGPPTSPENPGRAVRDDADPELRALRADNPQWLIKRTSLSGYAYALIRGTTTRFARSAAEVPAIIGRET